MKNYYNILGVPADASEARINEAYKKLAIKFHPDKNPGDPFFSALFTEINEANRVLGNKESRGEYDDKLNNYSEAYDLFKDQLHDQKFDTIVKQERYKRSKNRYKGVVLIGALAVLLVAVLFLINGESTKMITSENFENTHFEIEPMNDSAAKFPVFEKKPVAYIESKKTTAPPAKKTTAPPANKKTAPVTSNNLQPYKVSVPPQHAKPIVAGRSLKNSEIDDIVKQLNSKNSAHGVQIIQSVSSNISKDFEIATRLQQKGFAITGRGFTSKEIKGIIITEKDNRLTLSIGVIN